MSVPLYGICANCRQRVAASHVVDDGKVYLRKDCPDCGPSQNLVSNDAAVWQHKRDLWHYEADSAFTCHIDCDSCGHDHHPRMLFLDVTNRCNMNCPICIANIPSMGFEFHPPLSYFDHVLEGLAKFDPKPTIQLFGGEPTVRDDLFDIIDLCHRHGLRVRIVTNGLRLADEDYCRRLCATKTPVLLALDGRDPEIYRRLRKSPTALARKLRALENLKKHSRRKNTIMVCVARNVNDRHMGDLIQMCHEYRDVVTALHLIPLAQTWEPGEFETDVATTTEDVEKIIADAMPDERVDFLPAGLGSHLDRAMDFFGGIRLSFGGVHPNCESITLFLGDADRYHAVGHYLKRPFGDLAADLVNRARAIAPRLARLDPKRWSDRLRGRLLVFRKLLWPALRAVSFRKLLKGNRVLTALRILGGLAAGRRPKDVLRKHTTVQSVLRMIVLPFEEHYTIDGSRLAKCTAGFAYEDPDTGEVKTCPVCSWSLYKTDIMKKLALRYAPEPALVAASAEMGS